jgi:hypothetical protein
MRYWCMGFAPLVPMHRRERYGLSAIDAWRRAAVNDAGERAPNLTK